MKKQQFNIKIKGNEKYQVNGYLVKDHKYSPEIQIFVFKDLVHGGTLGWRLTEYKTGMGISFNYDTRKQAIESVDKIELSKDRFVDSIQSIVERYGNANS